MDTRELIDAYHLAWTNGDFVTARNCLADDLDFRGSMYTFTKADDFIAALTQFRQMVQSVELLQQFYDETGAALLYDCQTASPAGVIRTAEFLFRKRRFDGQKYFGQSCAASGEEFQ